MCVSSSKRDLGKGLIVLFSLTLFCSAFFHCKGASFTEPQILGGVLIPAKILEQGQRVYLQHCTNCHGIAGDGKGVSAFGQSPPPRDFRIGKFVHAKAEGHGLASDEELMRVIRQGIPNTYMRPWNLNDSELWAVVQYLKTFSREGEGYRRPEKVLAE